MTIYYQRMPIYIKRKARNRIKAVLAEKDSIRKWMAEQLGKTESTVWRWCKNDTQPNLDTLYEVASILKIDARELLTSNKA